MKKIKTQEEIEKSQKFKSWILTAFLLLILVGSVAGYAFYQRDPSITTSNSSSGKVQELGNQWVLNLNGNNFYFSNSPDSVKNISVNIAFSLQDYSGKVLYISSDNDAVSSEIANTLGLVAQRTQLACYGNCTKDLPNKDCKDYMVVFNEMNESRIYQKDNCVFIEGEFKAADAFLYKLFLS